MDDLQEQDNYGVVRMHTALQSIEHPTNLGISKTDRGKVGLNGFSPLLVRGHVCMISIRLYRKVPLTGRIIDFLGQLFAKGRNIVQIPFRYRGQFNAVEWM